MKNIIEKSLFQRSISMSKFIFLITLIDMLIYHIPFYKYAVSNLNIDSINGLLDSAPNFV